MELDYGVSVVLHRKACAAMHVITSGQNKVRVIIRRALPGGDRVATLKYRTDHLRCLSAENTTTATDTDANRINESLLLPS